MAMLAVVLPHDPTAAEKYRSESQLIRDKLGSALHSIYHIGSTAIPGIHAKPIIDMLGAATNIADMDQHNASMARLGYEALGELGIAGRRYFRKENHQSIRTHHLHVFAVDSPHIERHLTFRDFLIHHPDLATEYSELKQSLAKKHCGDIEKYMDGKDAFIKDIDRRASLWKTNANSRSFNEDS